jgi:hypothetical protein
MEICILDEGGEETEALVQFIINKGLGLPKHQHNLPYCIEKVLASQPVCQRKFSLTNRVDICFKLSHVSTLRRS